MSAAVSSIASAQTAVADPVATIQKGPLSVAVTPFIPRVNTPGGSAAARLQGAFVIPGAGNRYLTIDQRGVIYNSVPGQTPTVFLDLRSTPGINFKNTGEDGLAGLAFHPDFANAASANFGKFYTSYSVNRNTAVAANGEFIDYLANDNGDHESVIREWTVNNPAATAFSGTSREVMRVGQFASNHNINTIAFNPNAAVGSPERGKLYVSFGDGGGGDDPRNYGQSLTSPLGKILRIDPATPSGGKRYTVPGDNPGISGAVPEIWARGLRNPQQFSWDTGGTNRMFIGDIGQGEIEEINIGIAGANYGWQLREGTFATGEAVGQGGGVYPLPAGDASNGFTYPVGQYDHDDGNAVGGGFVYRGSALPQLVGKYVFTDFSRDRIFYLDEATLANGQQQVIQELRVTNLAGTEQTLRSLLGGSRADARLALSPSGELLIVTKNLGTVYAIVPEPSSLGLIGLGAVALLRRRRA